VTKTLFGFPLSYKTATANCGHLKTFVCIGMRPFRRRPTADARYPAPITDGATGQTAASRSFPVKRITIGSRLRR
jgi:hypothetical protein